MDQGVRADLDRARYMGRTDGMRAVAAVCSFQQSRTAMLDLKYNEVGRNFTTHVRWIYGSSGSGKTQLANAFAKESGYVDDLYWKKEGSNWWEGYDNHRFVVIDDIRADWWPYTYLLSLLDSKPMRVECKGGSRQFLAREVVLTSILHPRDMFMNKPDEPVRQILRRVDEIIDMDERNRIARVPTEPLPEVSEVGKVILDASPLSGSDGQSPPPLLRQNAGYWQHGPTWAPLGGYPMSPTVTTWPKSDKMEWTKEL